MNETKNDPANESLDLIKSAQQTQKLYKTMYSNSLEIGANAYYKELQEKNEQLMKSIRKNQKSQNQIASSGPRTKRRRSEI